jgi:hypothetical protein
VASIVLLGLGIALIHCGGATEQQLRTRAAFDLDCAENKLRLLKLDTDTMGVTGCGQRATYVQSCDAPANNATRSCTWVLNSETKPTTKKRQGPKDLADEEVGE